MRNRLIKRAVIILNCAVCAVCAVVMSGFATQIKASDGERAISFYHTHTKETLSLVFKRDGQFIPDALEKFNHVTRDWRANKQIKMDPELLDLIWEMHRELGSKKPVHIVSAYRSPGTNAMLRRVRGGQARNSQHMHGRAMDIYFPDVDVKQLRNSALIRERGGVGYYPTSASPFVHVDTANVRHWPRMPRQELAILFPKGKSQHVPTDGKPLTQNDFKVALANFKARGAELPIGVQRMLGRPSKPLPQPVLASLGPTSLPFSIPQPSVLRDKPAIAASPAAPASGLVTPVSLGSPTPDTKPESLIQATPVAVSSQPASLSSPASLGAQPDFGRGFVTAALPRPGSELSDDQIGRAPEYDEDHPEESNYQPFAIAPLLTDTPLAYADFTRDARTPLRKVQVLFAEPNAAIAITFERGPQYEGMYWAQRFTGPAVSGAISKFVANDATANTVLKTAQNLPGK